VMNEWVGNRLFELFFGLHVGKFRSIRTLVAEPAPAPAPVLCGAMIHFPCSPLYPSNS
jgi:hypothetical protein